MASSVLLAVAGTVLGLGLLASTATGAINIGASIDWLCECMPHIALTEVRQSSRLSDPSRIRPLSHAPARTIRVLKGHPPDSAEVSLLKDDAVDSLVTYDGRGHRKATPMYPVREAAYQALRQIGIKVPPPKGHVERWSPRLPLYDVGDILQP